jgi:hypothetical protein
VSIDATTMRASIVRRSDTDHGDASPRVDDDPLVEDAVEDVDEARST